MATTAAAPPPAPYSLRPIDDPPPTRSRRPMSPTSLRDLDPPTPGPSAPTAVTRSPHYPAPPTGHDLMALFPPAAPYPAPSSSSSSASSSSSSVPYAYDAPRIPTSGYFARQERAFFAQAGKEIVRVRVDVDFDVNGREGYLRERDRERESAKRRWPSAAVTGGVPLPPPAPSAPTTSSAANSPYPPPMRAAPPPRAHSHTRGGSASTPQLVPASAFPPHPHPHAHHPHSAHPSPHPSHAHAHSLPPPPHARHSMEGTPRIHHELPPPPPPHTHHHHRSASMDVDRERERDDMQVDEPPSRRRRSADSERGGDDEERPQTGAQEDERTPFDGHNRDNLAVRRLRFHLLLPSFDASTTKTKTKTRDDILRASVLPPSNQPFPRFPILSCPSRPVMMTKNVGVDHSRSQAAAFSLTSTLKTRTRTHAVVPQEGIEERLAASLKADGSCVSDPAIVAYFEHYLSDHSTFPDADHALRTMPSTRRHVGRRLAASFSRRCLFTSLLEVCLAQPRPALARFDGSPHPRRLIPTWPNSYNCKRLVRPPPSCVISWFWFLDANVAASSGWSPPPPLHTKTRSR
ncbi:hypothetical protein R3P38DRAFT_3426530 [Favolaschia claudopus]|uniref:Uncharacterized protein n=1 Tax=Favolaschia claudopus TaxID=2862362 RepID=A0AAV9ZW77_9AGAR